MLKKSAVLLSYNALPSLNCSGTTYKTSSCGPLCRPPTPSNHRRQQCQQFRPYAVVSDGHSRHNHDSHRWPEMTTANTIPTPYQIFGQKKGAPYSKQRFYELVKLYHPDRHDPTTDDGISCAAKLERYRLIVAANDILSDPIKRSAFDRYGAGWNNMPEVKTRQDQESSPGGNGRRGNGWDGPDGPSQNATWEDWEKWYARDAKGPQEPTFSSNSAFVALVVLLATLGGIGQATRVGDYSMSFIEQRDAHHAQASKDLIRRRNEATTRYGSREERIHSFLKERDPFGHATVDAPEEQHRKMLPSPDICLGDISTRRLGDYRSNDCDRKG